MEAIFMQFCTQTDILWSEQGLAGPPLGRRQSPLWCGVLPSLSFPATLAHGLPCSFLTGGTSPGESAPVPGAVRRFLQQDMHHFIWRLTSCPVVKDMDITLLYLCSRPSIVINAIYYTNAFAWHIDFVVLEMKSFTGAEKKKEPTTHQAPPCQTTPSPQL